MNKYLSVLFFLLFPLGVKAQNNYPKQENKKESFIIWSVNKDTVNLGETLRCYCDLYTTENIKSVKYPNVIIDDCYYNEVSNKEKSFEVVVYKGDRYNGTRLFEFDITPLRKGKIDIGGNTFDCIIGEEVTDFFNPLKTREESIKSNLINLFVCGEDNNGQFIFDNIVSETTSFLLCDISSSMYAKDIYPDRRKAMTKFVNQWIDRNLNTGLITFAGSIEMFLEPENVQRCIKSAPIFLDSTKVDGTSLGDALLAPLSKGFISRDIVVITDGSNNCGHFSATTSLNLLRYCGTRIHYIYLNTLEDSVKYFMPIMLDDNSYSYSDITCKNERLSPKEMNQFKKLVRLTGGDFYTIKTEEDLNSVISIIERKTKKTKKKEKQIMPYDKTQIKKALNMLSLSIND